MSDSLLNKLVDVMPTTVSCFNPCSILECCVCVCVTTDDGTCCTTNGLVLVLGCVVSFHLS